MQSHFIKDTKEQYSIREDGVVIRHYRVRFNANTREYYTEHKEYISLGSRIVTIVVNGIKKQATISVLLRDHFGFCFCTSCKDKVESTHSTRTMCDKCKRPRTEITKEWWANNEDKRIGYYNKNIKDLSKSYVAQILHIPLKDLSEELYQLKKIVIKTKRLCLQQQIIQP